MSDLNNDNNNRNEKTDDNDDHDNDKDANRGNINHKHRKKSSVATVKCHHECDSPDYKQQIQSIITTSSASIFTNSSTSIGIGKTKNANNHNDNNNNNNQLATAKVTTAVLPGGHHHHHHHAPAAAVRVAESMTTTISSLNTVSESTTSYETSTTTVQPLPDNDDADDDDNMKLSADTTTDGIMGQRQQQPITSSSSPALMLRETRATARGVVVAMEGLEPEYKYQARSLLHSERHCNDSDRSGFHSHSEHLLHDSDDSNLLNNSDSNLPSNIYEPKIQSSNDIPLAVGVIVTDQQHILMTPVMEEETPMMMDRPTILEEEPTKQPSMISFWDTILPKSTQNRRICVATIALVAIAIIATVAVICGSGTCGGSSSSTSTTFPDIQQCFTNIHDLHNAIDFYIINDSIDTIIAKQYGYPINTWCFDQQLKSLQSTFDAERNNNLRYYNFNNSSNFNLYNWDTSNIIDMSFVFRGTERFNNDDIIQWDVSNVQTMESMFENAVSFNQNISIWDMSNVKNLNRFVYGASNFDLNLCNWDLSSIRTKYDTFVKSGCPVPQLTNRAICYPCVPTVSPTTILPTQSIQPSFTGSTEEPTLAPTTPPPSRPGFTTLKELYAAVDDYLFDLDKAELSIASLTYGYPMSTWNVSNVKTFENLFDSARFTNNLKENVYKFNESLAGWDVSSATSMNYMFLEALSFSGDGLETWDVSGVEKMLAMFAFTRDFVGPSIKNWNVGNVVDMEQMFYQAESFNTDISEWNVSKVNTMSAMFSQASSFNRSLCSWGAKVRPEVLVAAMFNDTACPDTNEPIIPNGPFCYIC